MSGLALFKLHRTAKIDECYEINVTKCKERLVSPKPPSAVATLTPPPRTPRCPAGLDAMGVAILRTLRVDAPFVCGPNTPRSRNLMRSCKTQAETAPGKNKRFG